MHIFSYILALINNDTSKHILIASKIVQVKLKVHMINLVLLYTIAA